MGPTLQCLVHPDWQVYFSFYTNGSAILFSFVGISESRQAKARDKELDRALDEERMEIRAQARADARAQVGPFLVSTQE